MLSLVGHIQVAFDQQICVGKSQIAISTRNVETRSYHQNGIAIFGRRDQREFAPNSSTRSLDRNPMRDPIPARWRRYRIELKSCHESRSRWVRSTAFLSDSSSFRIAARLDSRCSFLTVRIDAKSNIELRGNTHTHPIRSEPETRQQ